jgi:hypothetical protein
MEALFESDEVESWRKGDWLMHLHLDSLDECLLRIDNVAAILADELPKQPVDRLHLRIACRTAPCPALLENALEDLYGDCPAYELAPLRRIDVLRAAEQSGISNPDAFLQSAYREFRLYLNEHPCGTLNYSKLRDTDGSQSLGSEP